MNKAYIFCTSEYRNDNSMYTVVNESEAINVVNSKLVIIIDNDNKIDNYELFKLIYKVSSKNNTICMIGVALDSEYEKNIFSLAVAKSIYNIYDVESLDVIDDEYLSVVLNKKNTLHDIENYISSDITFSERVGEILLEIINKCCDGDDESLLHYIRANMDTLKGSVYYSECMRSLNDKLTDEVGRMEEERDEMSVEYGEMKKGVKEKDAEIQKLRNNIEVYKGDIAELRRENENVVAQLNRSGPTVSNFQQINIGTVQRRRTKHVLYFKEVSYVRFVNSLIMSMVKMLGLSQGNLRVRLLIFDNKNDFSAIYKPLNIVSLQEYVMHKDRLLASDALVVVEPNHVIVEEMLRLDHDLLIIYDRLKLAKDIVHGNEVYKYWVINSRQNYEEVKDSIIDSKYVITRPRVLDKCLAIPEIENYNQSTESAKIYKYRALENWCQEPSGLIVENILNRVGIELPRRR